MALPRKLSLKIYEIKAHNGLVTSLDLGETGRVLVTGGQDRNVNLWAIGTEECFMSLTGHNSSVECVRFAYKDNYVYSGDDIGIIRRWDLNSEAICSSLNGHMKSVRTLDFNPSGEYVISGSNDTTVRLWDVRNENKCIKIYRGHIAQVNSVKFSPDGLWIASAGTEGSVLIWDVRKSKQILNFTEQPPAPAISCIQFHPFEFLLAVGRADGTVFVYDLETESLITKTGSSTPFYGHPIKCLVFSENGECLFVGNGAGISVIGWEPDREFDYIRPMWNELCDMKDINHKLICGSYDKDTVTINALSINRLFPFYNPSNEPCALAHNSSTRKSFSRGNQKFRLSISGPKQSSLVEENEGSKSSSLDGQSSPNLSLELVDDPLNDFCQSLPPTTTGVDLQLPSDEFRYSEESSFEINMTNFSQNTTTTSCLFQPIPGSFDVKGYGSNGLRNFDNDGPRSLKESGSYSLYDIEKPIKITPSIEVESALNDSNPPIISNYDQKEMLEDFPVNQNIYHESNATSVGSTATTQTAKSVKTKEISQKRNLQTVSTGQKVSTSSFQQRSRLSHVTSVSTTDLNKLDDGLVLQKSASSHHAFSKGKRTITSQTHISKENARNKSISVQIKTKPPTRSRTSFELRSPAKPLATPTSAEPTYTNTSRPESLLVAPKLQQKIFYRNEIDEGTDIDLLSSLHEQVFQELCNRQATLQSIYNAARSQDILGVFKQALKFNNRPVIVDLLGAILEKTSSWNLDLCLLMLPVIYELLQSDHKFHFVRACDTLRVIVSNFQPIIRDNLDPWSANGLGVDVTREERQRKCLDCRHWLLQIRNLPEINHFGSSFTQLQKTITI